MFIGEKTVKKRRISKNGLRCLFLIGIMAILSVFFSFAAPGFLSVDTFMNVIKQNTSLAILSLGVTFIIMLAGTDLSTGSNIAFAGAVGAFFMPMIGGAGVLQAVVGFAATCVGGMLIGALNGLMIGICGVSAFMVTLATMSLARGLTVFITNSRRIVVENDVYNWFGQGDFTVFGIDIPCSLILLAALFLIMHFILSKTTFGRKTEAIGGNATAARASGIRVKRHTAFVYLIGGLFSGLAAIVTVGRARSAQPLAGQGVEFDAITAVVIGGTSLSGGRGSLAGSVLGAMLTGLIFSGLGMMSISSNYTYIVKGALIILAVWMDSYADIMSSRVKGRKDVKSAQGCV